MINNYFQLDERQTNIRTEIVAGATTFLTMAYIIFVNPGILAQTGMDKTALVTATCLATAIATLIVGLVARAPIAMAPGMGLNAFFTYTLVMGQGVNWQTALGVVFLSGFVFLVLTLLGLRRRLVEAIPSSLISAIAVGIGLFITFIGLRNLGVVVKNEATLVSAGPITRTVVIGLLGLLVMIFLEMKKAKGALLIGIVFATLLAGLSGEIEMPAQIFSTELNITTLVFSLDIRAALKWSLFGSIFSLMFIDMFDSVGTL
ncbi:MAG: NCS2 family permease, partial [candidate division Zixibacteria bacterium]